MDLYDLSRKVITDYTEQTKLCAVVTMLTNRPPFPVKSISVELTVQLIVGTWYKTAPSTMCVGFA